jgi:energy-coupling factor transporter transmembrane protein EcfT
VHEIALALYALAALCLVAMVVASRKIVWRFVKVPPGWMFLSAAVLLCVIGIAFDSV